MASSYKPVFTVFCELKLVTIPILMFLAHKKVMFISMLLYVVKMLTLPYDKEWIEC